MTILKRALWGLYILMLLGGAVVTPTLGQQQQITCFRDVDYIRLIDEAMQAEDFELALAYADCILRYYRNSAYTYVIYSSIYFRMGDYEQALEFIDMALARDTNNGIALYLKAYIYFYQQEYQQCVQVGETALIFSMPQYEIYDLLMRCAHFVGDYALSAEMATEILTLNMNLALEDVYFYRAYAFYELGQYRDALADLRQALLLYDGSSLSAFELQAKIWLALELPLLAYASLERARYLESSYDAPLLYEAIWRVLEIEDAVAMNKQFFTQATELYAQRSRIIEAFHAQNYAQVRAELEQLADLPYGMYTHQYAVAMLARVSFYNRNFADLVSYSNIFAETAMLSRVVRFPLLPDDPVVVQTGFWNGATYRFNVRPNETYTFVVEAVDNLRVVDPYIVILSGATQLVVEAVGEDTLFDGRVEFVFSGEPRQYILFVGGFGHTFGAVRISHTKTR